MSEGGAGVQEQTEVGSYFVANYPPFSVWTKDAVAGDARPALAAPPPAKVPLGLYLHIPFCRKRCHFCYFRVYTDKNSREVAQYLDILAREWELYLESPALAGRPLDFVYFGGGTPSFLSTKQLEDLVGRLTARTPWTDAEEITFECEPGTLTESKLEAIRGMGVTRLSLGIENFDDRILELNGRAHRSPEVFKAYDFAREARLPADQRRPHRGHARGDRGELAGLRPEDARSRSRQRHHLPDGAALQHHDQQRPPEAHRPVQRSGRELGHEAAVGRRGVRGARSAPAITWAAPTPLSKDPKKTRFVYRDRLWEGADLVGLGVASFGHVSGVHMQNLDTWETYSAAVERGEIPLGRAYRPTDEERMIRELVLQLKRGSIRPAYFRTKYGVDVLSRFQDAIASLQADGFLAGADEEKVALSRSGLLRVDVLLPRFFLPAHAGIRYT